MKIFYDNKIFSLQKYGGVSKYFVELLKEIPSEMWFNSTIISNNEYLKSNRYDNYANFFPDISFRGKVRLMDLLNRPYTIHKILTSNFDVFHQTDFSSYYFSFLKNKPFVTTFHDMNYSKYKELYTNKNDIITREKLQRKSVDRADKIIAISNSTKNDLIQYWNVDPNKIVVVHHGVDKTKFELDSNRIVANPYLLFVGERFGFKNFKNLIIAFSKISNQFLDLKVVCTGPALTKDEVSFLNEYKMFGRVIQISADEKTMAKLYRDAEMFIFPSISEGFGMPILEAMVYDCPLLISNASCFPEIAGNAAIYFNPFNVDEIAEKIISVLHSYSLRERMISFGYERLKNFSWKKTADQHLAVYRSVL